MARTLKPRVLAAIAAACAVVAILPMSRAVAQGPVKVRSATPFVSDVRPGPGVTAVKNLSDYSKAVASTAGDTRVYVLDGKEPGGTMFVLGGTHGNEIAGIMAAIVLVERARVQKGRLIVIPHANNSAITDVDPERPGPDWITLKTPSGDRRFKYGSRRTKLADQGKPDPPRYRHPKSEEMLDGNEARNLNRAYPGRADGNLTQRMAFAIVQALKTEQVDLAFDLHEAGPESRLAWMIVANPKNIEVGATAVLMLESEGITMKLEPSSDVFRGLSHREWGDETKAQAFLFETPSPGQVSNTKGADVVNDAKLPLSRRVGVQLSCLRAVVDAYNEAASPDRRVGLMDVPRESDVVWGGLGTFLK
ncbi:MAG: succinylglutamate desuccinylase/aspartoacylase family protein [Acidobacteria bacterium]|nr:succinylglutamate desuccinylase/aspartoacylase family protein [Acidobacteriota bacterium]